MKDIGSRIRQNAGVRELRPRILANAATWSSRADNPSRRRRNETDRSASVYRELVVCCSDSDGFGISHRPTLESPATSLVTDSRCVPSYRRRPGSVGFDIGQYKRGLSHGLLWARKLATLDEITRLETLEGGLSKKRWESWFAPDADLAPVADRFYSAVIDPNPWNVPGRLLFTLNHQHSNQFWKKAGATTKQRNSAESIRGFAEGALIMWREVSQRNDEPQIN